MMSRARRALSYICFGWGLSSSRPRWRLALTTRVLALLVMLLPPPLFACPVGLFNLELNSPVFGPRSGLRLFVRQAASPAPKFLALPIQVDPVDEVGHFVFPKGEQWKGELMKPSDMLSFRVEAFGSRLDPRSDRLPCQGPQVFELLHEESGRYAYLTNCELKNAPPQPQPRPVTFELGKHRLESKTYLYRFNPANYMQFDSIDFKIAERWVRAAHDSRLLIRADVRKFFTMSFDSHEIESQLEATRVGPVGNIARLSFFLRILFFKIRMSLSTDVAFYDDSAHIPMQVSIPVNAPEYLNAGSGILYSWIQSPEASVAPEDIKMPILSLDEVKKGPQKLAEIGRRFCWRDSCRYAHGMSIAGRRLSMDLAFKKKLVDRGFFPLFVPDVGAMKEAMGWDIEIPQGTRRIGMYFEVSGLSAGAYPWDFWLKLGGGARHETSCPSHVSFQELPIAAR